MKGLKMPAENLPEIKTDVLIIGSEVAGAKATIEARRMAPTSWSSAKGL